MIKNRLTFFVVTALFASHCILAAAIVVLSILRFYDNQTTAYALCIVLPALAFHAFVSWNFFRKNSRKPLALPSAVTNGFLDFLAFVPFIILGYLIKTLAFQVYSPSGSSTFAFRLGFAEISLAAFIAGLFYFLSGKSISRRNDTDDSSDAL